MPEMLICTIDFCHYMPLFVTLILPGGHKDSTKQSFWLHFLPQFSSGWGAVGYGVEAALPEHPEATFE